MTAVLILSGGASSRMGQDKAGLPVNGKTLLQWQSARFQDAGYEVVSDLPDHFPGHRGPLAGIHAACQARADIREWLVLPVDMPRFTIPAARALIRAGQSSDRAVCFQSSPLPLFLPVSDSLTQTLSTWLEDPDGRRSVYALITFLNGAWLDAPSLQPQLTNINTPEQWQSFLDGASL